MSGSVASLRKQKAPSSSSDGDDLVKAMLSDEGKVAAHLRNVLAPKLRTNPLSLFLGLAGLILASALPLIFGFGLDRAVQAAFGGADLANLDWTAPDAATQTVLDTALAEAHAQICRNTNALTAPPTQGLCGAGAQAEPPAQGPFQAKAALENLKATEELNGEITALFGAQSIHQVKRYTVRALCLGAVILVVVFGVSLIFAQCTLIWRHLSSVYDFTSDAIVEADAGRPSLSEDETFDGKTSLQESRRIFKWSSIGAAALYAVAILLGYGQVELPGALEESIGWVEQLGIVAVGSMTFLAVYLTGYANWTLAISYPRAIYCEPLERFADSIRGSEKSPAHLIARLADARDLAKKISDELGEATAPGTGAGNPNSAKAGGKPPQSSSNKPRTAAEFVEEHEASLKAADLLDRAKRAADYLRLTDKTTLPIPVNPRMPAEHALTIIRNISLALAVFTVVVVIALSLWLDRLAIDMAAPGNEEYQTALSGAADAWLIVVGLAFSVTLFGIFSIPSSRLMPFVEAEKHWNEKVTDLEDFDPALRRAIGATPAKVNTVIGAANYGAGFQSLVNETLTTQLSRVLALIAPAAAGTFLAFLG